LSPRPVISPGNCLRLTCASELRVGQTIIVGWHSFLGGLSPYHTVESIDPIVRAAKVTRALLTTHADQDAYEIRWEGDEHAWAICRPTALFVVCEWPEGS
jgi:hypothetical protein